MADDDSKGKLAKVASATKVLSNPMSTTLAVVAYLVSKPQISLLGGVAFTLTYLGVGSMHWADTHRNRMLADRLRASGYKPADWRALGNRMPDPDAFRREVKRLMEEFFTAEEDDVAEAIFSVFQLRHEDPGSDVFVRSMVDLLRGLRARELGELRRLLRSAHDATQVTEITLRMDSEGRVSVSYPPTPPRPGVPYDTLNPEDEVLPAHPEPSGPSVGQFKPYEARTLFQRLRQAGLARAAGALDAGGPFRGARVDPSPDDSLIIDRHDATRVLGLITR